MLGPTVEAIVGIAGSHHQRVGEHRNEYNNALLCNGSHGALAAVRWNHWKLYLNPDIQLYDLEKDPGEFEEVPNQLIARKLRGLVVLFQEEMRRDARPAG